MLRRDVHSRIEINLLLLTTYAWICFRFEQIKCIIDGVLMILGKAGALAGALALAAVWPFAIGHIAQSMYENELNTLPSSFFDVETLSYQRGYLSSEIKTRVKLQNPMIDGVFSDLLPKEAVLITYLDHGLLGVTGRSVIDMTPEIKALTKVLWKTEGSPLLIKTDFSLLKHFEFDLSLKAIDFVQNKMKLASSPFLISGSINRNKVISFETKVDLLNFRNPFSEDVLVENFMSYGHGKIKNGFWLGEQTFKLSHLGLNDKKETQITLNDFSLETRNDLKKEKKNNEISEGSEDLMLYSKSLFSFKELNYSNILMLNKLKIGIDLQEIYFPSLIKLLNSSNNLENNANESKMAVIISALDSILEKGIRLNITPFEFDSQEGNINGELSLGLNSGLSDLTKKPLNFKNNLDGKIRVHLPLKYVEGIPALTLLLKIPPLSDFVSKTKEGVDLLATLEKGFAVSSNGQKIPIEIFLSALM